jgi:hypothetical protein
LAVVFSSAGPDALDALIPAAVEPSGFAASEVSAISRACSGLTRGSGAVGAS